MSAFWAKAQIFTWKNPNFPAQDSLKTDSIVSKKSWINPNDFSAFQIIDGKTKSVFNRKTGLIENNIIDSVSEDIINDFRKIAYISASK